MAHRPYKRLPGRSNGLLNSSTLWEADDHLLLVESHRVTESYKRFFYRDIQAVVICQTKGGLVISIVLGVFTALFCVLAITSEAEPRIAFGVVAAFLLLLTLINHFRGPTCRTTLQTAVQTQELLSLNRLRNARKVLLRIQPKIANAQQAVSSPQ